MYHQDSPAVLQAKAYLGGAKLSAPDLDALYPALKDELEVGYARRVLALYRQGRYIQGDLRWDTKKQERLCQQHALCTSKGPDLSAAIRHDEAMQILGERFDLRGSNGGAITSDQETLGIAGGICKRRWEAFGQIDDLHRSLGFYEHGYRQGVTQDYGYTAINATFVNDLLASLGDRPEERRSTAGTPEGDRGRGRAAPESRIQGVAEQLVVVLCDPG
jgi:hypothetical protein